MSSTFLSVILKNREASNRQTDLFVHASTENTNHTLAVLYIISDSFKLVLLAIGG